MGWKSHFSWRWSPAWPFVKSPPLCLPFIPG